MKKNTKEIIKQKVINYVLNIRIKKQYKKAIITNRENVCTLSKGPKIYNERAKWGGWVGGEGGKWEFGKN